LIISRRAERSAAEITMRVSSSTITFCVAFLVAGLDLDGVFARLDKCQRAESIARRNGFELLGRRLAGGSERKSQWCG